MATESPTHPAPDQLPDHERTGNEPNPSGHVEPKNGEVAEKLP
jgi:hypothetical protein